MPDATNQREIEALVENLRIMGEEFLSGYPDYTPGSCELIGKDCIGAADAIEALVKENATLTRQRDQAASTGSGCFRELAMDATLMAIALDNEKKENASLREQRKRVLALFHGSSLVDSSIYADICEIYEAKAE